MQRTGETRGCFVTQLCTSRLKKRQGGFLARQKFLLHATTITRCGTFTKSYLIKNCTFFLPSLPPGKACYFLFPFFFLLGFEHITFFPVVVMAKYMWRVFFFKNYLNNRIRQVNNDFTKSDIKSITSSWIRIRSPVVFE